MELYLNSAISHQQDTLGARIQASESETRAQIIALPFSHLKITESTIPNL